MVPPYVKTYGDEVNDFMTQLGRPPDPWQADIVRCAFGMQDDGLWAAYELMVLLARQNGKGYVTDAIELGGLFLFREQLILHSAHIFKTSRAAFIRLEELCKNSDWLSRRVARVSRSKGDEGIYLTSKAGGGSLEFIARTEGTRAAGRGLTGSTTVFDEAFALTIGQFQAQTPTLSTIPNPRMVYTSTPPDEDSGPLPEDAMLPSVRKRGHRGEDRTACFEWSPEPGLDLLDADAVAEETYRCNPAEGIRISEWFLRKQYMAFTEAGKPAKYATEHLGEWPPDAAEQWQYVPEREWHAAEDPDSKRQGEIALAIEMSLDRQWSSIHVAGKRADGLYHIEVAVSDRGSGWVVPKVVQMRDRLKPCAIVVPSSSPAAALLPDLDAALKLGIGQVLVDKVEVMSAVEMAQACGGLYDGIAGPEEAGKPSPRTVRHRGQGVLTTAIAGAVTKNAGNSMTFDHRATAVDATPASGVAAALWAYRQYGERPDKFVLSGALMG